MKLLPFLALLGCSAVVAQTLPPPSRTVYRCEDGGKVNYSDSPCLGAKKLEVEPTRGMNKSTGKQLQGQDVRREHLREGFAEMVKPVTGMDAKQLDQAGRRQRLSPDAQRQCRILDQQLPAAEAAESTAKADSELAAAQQRLLDLRAAYRKLRCE
ncbi:DUF4124 domain-containing protein [Roseateles asaccharophilus]|uniref:DUF4124 domain-containing protein n=1 Tax=Roseateles asaccharophilus TaxID=582607 RepID=A0ABU2AF11_9BURK|nr:DUF4124 domain-containing protein [Roseateles asaccharophilus]MDR7335798.1 hypothetical protein [Roseateles asaccharophilus]